MLSFHTFTNRLLNFDSYQLQDDGSGSAAILEVAIQMFNVNPKNKVRFAWWGAEEKGLLGSDYYVSNLSDKERKSIAMYLNFDMLGVSSVIVYYYTYSSV